MPDNINLDSPNSFGILDTMDMGMGNQELLNDLLSPETSTGDPDNLQKIVTEATPPAPDAKPAVPKGKEVVQKEEGEEVTAADAIANFLGDNTDGEEEEEEVKTPQKKAVIKEALNETGDEGEISQDTRFTALSNDLFKLGVFTQDDDEPIETIATPEQFLERFNNEKRKGSIEMVQSFIGQFGEDYQQAFEAIYVKGADPKEYFTAYNDIVDYSELDLTQEENQVKVMRQALADQGFEPEDITSEIDRLRNYGDLENVSAKHHKVLVKKSAVKLQEIEDNAERVLQNKAAIRNQFITNVQTVLQDKVKEKTFDGIPINPKIAGELHDYLLVDKWKTDSGETLSDFDRAILELKRPENHAQKVKLALLMKLLEKDPTLSTIQKTGVTRQTDALFGEVARQVTREGNKAPSTNKNNNGPISWFDQVNK